MLLLMATKKVNWRSSTLDLMVGLTSNRIDGQKSCCSHPFRNGNHPGEVLVAYELSSDCVVSLDDRQGCRYLQHALVQ